jgi:crossover junction endodeoxyribonuclease RuvC
VTDAPHKSGEARGCADRVRASGIRAHGQAAQFLRYHAGALCLPGTFLTPPTWKRCVGIPPGKDGAKDAARSEAIRRWPDQAALFARVKDDGRAEAALIAVAGLAKERQS